MADEWNEELKRFHERTEKRREKAKEHEEQTQRIIRESEERRDQDKVSE